MKFFLSAGEPSGDLHGANLARALRALNPATELTGLGGPLMRAAGCELMYPLADLAVMGLGGVFRKLPTFFRVADLAERHIRRTRPDAVVLIDYPGFHFALAKRLKAYGVPTYFFVPPQVWAWKRGRVRAMRKHFVGVLTALPFEDEWYRSRHVRTHYVGHPYFDELARQRLDEAFVAEQRAKPGARVALLPGSRNWEVDVNGPMLLSAARRVFASRPDARFLVAAFNEKHATQLRARLPAGVPVEVHTGRTPEIIELADCCAAVSGSVSLELLYRAKPTAIVYTINRLYKWLMPRVLKVPYITLVNLMAGAELFPEVVSCRDESERVAGHLLHWLNDGAARGALVAQLEALRARAAVPGACARAARFLSGESGALRAAA
jgi:lipid-A-disaccharide synthase